MSQSIEYVLALGGSHLNNCEDIASLDATDETMNNVKATLNTTESYSLTFREWTFDDGSIIHLWDAGRYSKFPWYFMAYSINESNEIRFCRANPTPDTSNE